MIKSKVKTSIQRSDAKVKKLEVDGVSEKKEVSKMDGMEVRSVF